MKFNILTPFELSVIENKGTERPHTGKYYTYNENGTYLCKKCNAPLYKSSDKFDANCGWPSFDDEIPNAIIKTTDADGQRTEITCANCGAHLGHVFKGENYTAKNIRHCVNSTSLNFLPLVINKPVKLERAIFAGGCFWGIEYYMNKQEGVISTTAGYIGGKTANPTYNDVCNKNTGHAEAIEIYFNPDIISFEELAKLFFELHDPTQIDRQGPDIGIQYRSEIFYCTLEQKEISIELIKILMNKGFDVQTGLTEAGEFYPAEKYHQDYYDNKGGTPYCHSRVKRF
ncbi:MAG: bifunctional methionine sulfoxide reductase B/A protein [Bacteroidota bacterium]|nr:bifunctional methionine sulfoxide reductase B/A protein [Bacteroidota bacterium]